MSHFELVEKVGEGGMGQVWKAIDTKLDRIVAIKFLNEAAVGDPRRLASFEGEAKAIAALSHPNIVTIYSVEEHDLRPFFAMEFVGGKTLAELIPTDGLALGKLLEIVLPLVEAVGAAHERGITHGDLKPSNVIVTESGAVKVLDFGLARVKQPQRPRRSDEPLTITATDDNALAGTIPYMSPEQLRGRVVDPRSDVFSLGVILYELATGRRPFLGATGAELAAAILKEEPTPITALVQQLPRPLWHVVRRCLQKQPERRFQHGFELKSELEQFPRESPDVASEPAASIAILPFTDTSREKDQDYFCEGIAEEIINALTKISGLEVAPKTSSFSFQGSSLDSREIGRRLGVSTLLGGSVRKAGDRLRIIVELIDAERSAYLWTERYDREMQDIFAIQEEIARSVADAFSVTLSSDERGSLCCVSTSDVHAYDFYLRGRKFYYQYRRQGIEFALQMFSKAIERDPGFASAYAGIADCHAYLYVNADRDEAHSRKADEASLRALELDPSSAQAHASRGVALSINGRCDEAEHAFEAAIRLDEQLFEAFYFYARMCFSQGKLQRAAQLYDRAAKLRADDYQALLLMAQVYDDLGQPENATSARRRGVRVAEARLELNPDDSRAWYMGANGLVALGDRERGLEWAARALALEPGEPMLLYNVACIRSMAGETEAAIDALEQAFARGFTYKEWVDHDSNLDAVRDHPRFKNLMASLS